MPKVSIIIPVYNVQSYVERCARSLFEQTLDDIEYIFVDDGSTDRSIDVLRSTIQEYPSRASHVAIITHEHNKGLPAARHSGLLKASGEYILHCDSDDYIDRSMCQTLYEAALGKKADIAVCDFYECFESQNVLRHGMRGESSDLLSDMLLDLVPSVWNKLVRREVALDGVVIPIHSIAEDLAVTVQYALKAKRVVYVPSPLYYYERRSSSIMGKRAATRLLNGFDQIVSNFNIGLKAIKDAGKEKTYRDAILHECLWIKNQLLPVMSHQNVTKLWRQTYREINSRVLFSKVVSKREKLNFLITFLGLYPLYCHIKKG